MSGRDSVAVLRLLRLTVLVELDFVLTQPGSVHGRGLVRSSIPSIRTTASMIMPGRARCGALFHDANSENESDSCACSIDVPAYPFLTQFEGPSNPVPTVIAFLRDSSDPYGCDASREDESTPPGR